MTGKDERLTFDPGFLRNEFLGDRRWHPPFTRQPTISWEEIASQGLSRGDLEVTMVDGIPESPDARGGTEVNRLNFFPSVRLTLSTGLEASPHLWPLEIR